MVVVYANGSKDCFGCIGLRGKQYCILNKQYTKDQYETLLPQIIEHMRTTNEWGEFFPPTLTPIGYNESLAAEYYPLDESDAKKLGYTWSNFAAPEASAPSVIDAKDLPDEINTVPDTLLNSAIRSQASTQLFRVTKQELAFYRQHQLPLPRLHPNERHRARLEKRGALSLMARTCSSCQIPLQTIYTEKRAPTLYCETCYLSKVY